MNKDITVIFITDLIIPTTYPDNVQFELCSLNKIISSLDRILNFKSNIPKPFKLCDVRPIYGLLFQEHINKFDFWGWGDIDVIYGHFSDFDLQGLMQRFDVISMRKKWLSGSFCLIKNTNFLNTLFLRSNDIEKIFKSPSYMGFDEISLCWSQVRTVQFNEIKWPTDNFTAIVLKATEDEEIKTYFNDHIKESIADSDYLVWNGGYLKDRFGNSYFHYHFITEKRKLYFEYPTWQKIPNKFFIDRAGFYTEEDFRYHKIVRILRMVAAGPRIFLSFNRKLFQWLFGLKKSKISFLNS